MQKCRGGEGRPGLRVAEIRGKESVYPAVVLSASNSSFNWSYLRSQEVKRLPNKQAERERGHG